MGKLFGTDGVRGVANDKLTPMLAFKLARTCGYILSKKYKEESPPYFVVGKDTRLSSDMLESAIVAGLCSVGVSVLKMGVTPTPVVSYLTSKARACGGVMISASHNPFEDNGIKFFNSNGFKLEDSQEEEIEALLPKYSSIPFPAGRDVGYCLKEKMLYIYVDSLWNIFGEEEKYDVLKGIKVVLDCANGAAFELAPTVLKDMGAEVIEINISPDGVNINENCGSTNPLILAETVVAANADLGIAFDGDADRVIAVDALGNVVDGDKLMAMFASYLKKTGRLKNNMIVSTVMSNLGFEKAMEKENINFCRTKVGDRYVLEEMIKSGAVIGGEQSGHIILLEYNNTGDGLITALMILKVMIDTGKTLAELSSSVAKYPQILTNIPVPDKESFLSNIHLREFIEKEEALLKGRGRIVVRPSGTEPIVRVMVEAMDEDEMNNVAEKIANEIKKELNG